MKERPKKRQETEEESLGGGELLFLNLELGNGEVGSWGQEGWGGGLTCEGRRCRKQKGSKIFLGGV